MSDDLDALLARAERTADTLVRLGRAMDAGNYDTGDTERDIAELIRELVVALRDVRDERDENEKVFIAWRRRCYEAEARG